MSRFFPMHRVPSILEDFGDEWLSESSGLSVWEDKSNVYVEAAVPGMKTEDIDITVEKGYLWIKAEKKSEEKDPNKKYYRKAMQSYSYRLSVPGHVDETKEPEATYQDGVMKIRFPKLPAEQPKKIAVKKSSGH